MLTNLYRRATRILPILILAMLPPLAISDNNSKASAYYEDAVKLFSEKNYDAALIQLKNVLQVNSRHLPALSLLGQTYIKTGNSAAAESALSDAMASGADKSLLIVPYANSLVAQLKYDQLLKLDIPESLSKNTLTELLFIRSNGALAINDFRVLDESIEQLETIDPNDVRLLKLKSTIAMRYGEYENAKNIIARMMTLYPRNEISLLANASIKHFGGDINGALGDYQKVLDVNPRNTSALLARAGLLIDLKRDEEAALDLKTLMGIDSGDPRTRYLRSIRFSRAGDNHGSQEELNAVINAIDILGENLVLRNEQLCLVAGVSHYKLGNVEQSKIFLEKYAEMGARNPEPLITLSRIYISQEEHFYAVKTLEQLLQYSRMTTEVLYLLTDAYHGAGMHGKAVALMKKAASLPNAPTEFEAKLAISRLEAGNIESGIAELEKVFKESSDIRTGVSLATTHIKRKNYRSADDILQKLLKINIDDPSLLNMLAISKIGLRDLSSAKQILSELLDAYPDNMATRVNLAKLEITEGKIENARSRLTEILAEDKKNSAAQIAMADSFEAEGDIKTAISWARDAATDHPANLSVQRNLVDLLLKTGDHAQALEVTTQLNIKSENNLDFMELQLRSYLAKKDLKSAHALLLDMVKAADANTDWLSRIALYQSGTGALKDASYTMFKAVQVTPKSMPLNAQLIEIDLSLGRFDVALDNINMLLKSYQKSDVGFLLKGDWHFRQKKFKDASKAYQKANTLKNSIAATIKLSIAQRYSNQTKLAEATLIKGYKKFPKSQAILQVLAEHYLLNEQYSNALTHYNELLTSRPKDAKLHNNISNVYFKLKNLETALKHAEKAYELNPTDALINDTLGWLLVNLSRTNDGIAYLRDALTRDANNPEIRYHLAVALHGLSRTSEARKELVLSIESGLEFEGRVNAKKLLDSLSE